MFGVDWREHDDRYAVADEWTALLKQLWTVEGESDFHGSHFDLARGVARTPSRCSAPTR